MTIKQCQYGYSTFCPNFDKRWVALSCVELNCKDFLAELIKEYNSASLPIIQLARCLCSCKEQHFPLFVVLRKLCCAIKDTVTGKHLSGDTFPEIRFASDISSQYPTRHLSRNHTICSVLKYKYTNIQIHKYRNAQIHKDSNT